MDFSEWAHTSIHVMYQYTEATKEFLYFCKNDYKVFKSIKGIHYKIGRQFFIGEKRGITFDIAGGFGIRLYNTWKENYQINDNFNFIIGQPSRERHVWLYPYYEQIYEKSVWVLSLSFSGSIKIGFFNYIKAKKQ